MSTNNRSRKILNLLKDSNENSEQDLERPNVSSDISSASVLYPVAVVQEFGSRSSSPLPPGAENIVSQLKDVVQDVFDNEMDDIVISKINSLEPNQDKSISITHELTPFDLEAPASFEASPLIEIEDLVNDTTFYNSELTIPTPMPSPLNIHSQCHNEFCSQHEDKSALVSSPSITSTSPRTPLTNDENLICKRAKKRIRRQNEWSSVKRKCLKNLGQKFVTKKGVLEDEKTLRPPCKCRYKCPGKISHQQRIDCFSRFWKLGDRSKQWEYIVKYTDKLKKKRCLNQIIPNNRKYTYKYYLPLISGPTNTQLDKIEVCQTMFINTLSVSTRILRTAWKKYDGSTAIEADQRGRHANHKSIINKAMIQSVCDHVKSFAPVESHYIRKDSKKLYLSGDLSIAKMHKLYLEWYDATIYSCKASKQRQYRDIVNSTFNLGFHLPKKDQCDNCHIFRQKDNPTEDEKQKYRIHDENKKVARNLKNKDKQDAIASEGKILTAVFDFEKVLTCPHGNVSIFYYKRKLSCFNFTVYDMGKKKGLCYMWDESVAKRGANEVSSCLLDFIQRNAEEGVKEFRFWSDNCAGQNRNRIVYSLYVYAAKKFNVTITHRFLEKGHTQNEGDSMHSVIERATQTKMIYTPDEWRLLAKWAKTEGQPYTVCNMTQDRFYDFKSHINNKVWQKNIRGVKINWKIIKEVNANCDDANKLFYKYDLTAIDSDILILRGNTRNSLQRELKPAYSEPLKIPFQKYKDLVSMCRSEVIPSEYFSYFESLPHHVIVEESEDPTDDEGTE